MSTPSSTRPTLARRGALVAAAIATGSVVTLPPQAMAAINVAKHPVTCAHQDDTAATASLPELRLSIACLLRHKRTALGAGAVRRDDALARAGTHQAAEMVSGRYFGHVSPSGEKLIDRLSRARWIPRAGTWDAGEILAWGTGRGASPAAFVTAWVKSAEHFAILKDRTFTEIGVGLVPGTPKAHGAGLTAAVEFGVR